MRRKEGSGLRGLWRAGRSEFFDGLSIRIWKIVK